MKYLNEKNKSGILPADEQEFYTQEQYLKAFNYRRDSGRLGTISSTISFIVLLTILFLDGFSWLNQWLAGYIDNRNLLGVAFFGILFLLSDLSGIPVDWYDTFVVEEKYGFNKLTVKLFIIDKLKSYLLAILLGGPLLFGFFYLITYLGSNFWIYALGISLVLMVLVNFLYTTLFLPIFNKLTPLPEGQLKEAIKQLAIKAEFPLGKIMVMDASKRSTKSNAFFAGFGKLKTIVLFDTLIEKHTEQELIGVLAHEIGHYKRHHIVSNMALSVITTAITLFLLSWVIFNPDFSQALGSETMYIHLNLIVFSILYEPIQIPLSLMMNIISRKHEYEADAFAVKYADKTAFKDALKKLNTDHLADLKPHPWYEFMYFSHPGLLNRLKGIDRAS